MIEAIIGREHGTNRLVMTMAGKVIPLSPSGIVPNTVSSKHCQLRVDGGQWTLTNIKSALYTYVDGIQIESKRIQPTCHVELGVDHFAVDMSKVRQAIDQAAPPTYSIRPLKRVWENYHNTQIRMQLDEKKKNVNRMLTGVLSPISMILFILPYVMKVEMPEWVNVLRLVIASLMALMSLYFFIQSRRGLKDDIILRMDRLNEDFRSKYRCPNPNCKHFFGNQPYDIIEEMPQCPYCKCQFEK
ncbi:MAG: FHA domain-containing protein [Bacteroidaceae bacterium]|nr:FHA domain-containing protein [Bacteroidaceae bacterium]MBQ9175667.1 FHA domain-containing protein [Bacteroidaceae bacterium]